MNEHRLRSIIKTITWRIIASFITASIVFFFTHKLLISLSIGGLDGLIKLVFYYFHERSWNKISWGIKR